MRSRLGQRWAPMMRRLSVIGYSGMSRASSSRDARTGDKKKTPKNGRTWHLLIALGCSAILATACTRTDSLFSGAPALTLHSHASVESIARCIALRWRTGARRFRSIHKGDTINLRAQSFYRGVNIGVRLKKRSGMTVVEYFERRLTAPPYAAMVRRCAMPDGTRAPKRIRIPK